MRFSRLLGDTPLVELDRIPATAGIAPGVRLLGKLEGNNPGGSVKDRAAWGMLTGALEAGEIQSGARLVEATSGNTGIALAMVAGRLGLHLTLIIPR
ncbi:MAG TPA: pyridoxal-phosphate dependent enzyme, partial [Longimicrobiales bacterium]|nr:pyridoxal-phosphate dependent enzyme [Longimicrobiales bacterium]